MFGEIPLIKVGALIKPNTIIDSVLPLSPSSSSAAAEEQRKN